MVCSMAGVVCALANKRHRADASGALPGCTGWSMRAHTSVARAIGRTITCAASADAWLGEAGAPCAGAGVVACNCCGGRSAWSWQGRANSGTLTRMGVPMRAQGRRWCCSCIARKGCKPCSMRRWRLHSSNVHSRQPASIVHANAQAGCSARNHRFVARAAAARP